MSIGARIFTLQIIIVIFALTLTMVIAVVWANKEYNSKRIELSSMQLKTFSELLLTINELERDIHRALDASQITNTPAFSDTSQKIIKRYLIKMKSLIKDSRDISGRELKWLEDDPEFHEEEIEGNNIKEMERQLINLEVSLKSLFSIQKQNQNFELRGLTYITRLNVLPTFRFLVERSIIDEASEILESNEQFYPLYLKYIVFGLIVSIVILSIIFGYNIYFSIRKYRTNSVIKQNQLQGMVALRTQELSQANKKLNEINEMREKFLADITHEIRTPMTAIRGEIEIRLRQTGQEESAYRDTLTRVKIVSDQITALTDDLLFISRAEKDDLHFDIQVSNIDCVILKVVDNYKVLAQDKKVEIHTAWPDAAIEFPMDKFRIKQAFSIVLDNAIKYSFPESKILISISSENEFVNISIQNHGEPISEEEKKYVFERFYRGFHKSSTQGSGLGLSIAKWIVERHNGQISFEASNDGVTEVTLKLPHVSQA